MKNLHDYLQILSWKDVRDEVAKVNLPLASEIDALDPDDSFEIVKARYRYGEHVLKQGVLQLPTADGKTCGIHHSEINKYLKTTLLRSANPDSGMPMGLTLNKDLELYTLYQNRLIPFSVMSPGKIFALWAVLDKEESSHTGRVWNITAGARSIIMLPKISEINSFWRLKKEFLLTEEIPRNFNSQY